MFSVLTDKGRQNFGLFMKEVDVLNYILLLIGDFTTIATLQPILMRVQCKKNLSAMWTRFFVLRAPIDTNKETFVFINFDRTFFPEPYQKSSKADRWSNWNDIASINAINCGCSLLQQVSVLREKTIRKFLGIRINNMVRIVSFLLFLSKNILRYSLASKSQ